MYRSLAVAVAALSIGTCVAAHGQDMPEPKPPEYKPSDKVLPTPIRSFSDASGRWQGMSDITTRVIMTVSPTGFVKFIGPNNLNIQAELLNDRMILKSRETEMDCILVAEFLTCNARFGKSYAALNLRKP